MPATYMPDEVFKDLQAAGRALSPRACKNTRHGSTPWVTKTRKISMKSSTLKDIQSQIQGYLIMGLGSQNL